MRQLTSLNEYWLPIHRYGGLYEVSSLGRIKNIAPFRRTSAFPYIKTTIHNGYGRVTLFDATGTRRTHLVSRLVAIAFIPNPLGKPQVNHIDGTKSNNSASNLEWTTSKENIRHSIIHGLKRIARGERQHCAKLNVSKVRQIRFLANKLSSSALAQQFGVSRRNINAIIKRTTWQHV